MLPTVSGEFTVVADPELRFSPSGVAVANVRLVANKKKKDDSGEWVDDKTCWLRATAFKKQAENLVESIAKGDLVTVTGQLETRNYEVEGEKRQSYEILIDNIGVSLKYATAKPVRAERTGGGGGGGGSASSDPWTTSGSSSDEPPF